MTDGATQFPCGQCGAGVEFAPGTQSLRCPYCGHETAIPESDQVSQEQDFGDVLARLEAESETEEVASVDCGSCAARVEPPPVKEAFPCPYCGSGIVSTATSTRLIKPQALLPFRVDRSQATGRFRAWIKGLWFAPGELKKLAQLEGRLQGLYTPYWTFDAHTLSDYLGQRGDDYQVRGTRTVTRDGKQITEDYTTTKTRWSEARGRVRRDFDDVLVVGSTSLPADLAEALEPWDLTELVPYTDDYLSGFQAERYQVDLPGGWERAAARMDQAIREDVEADIGGDHQDISWVSTRHDEVTFKHVLLPLWVCSYRYKDKAYRILVNARTGELQGQRPWSWIKIALTTLLAVGIPAGLYLATR